jgi:hypothetical protein
MPVFLVELVVVDEVGEGEQDSAKEGEEGCMLEMRVKDSANKGTVYYFDADWHLYSYSIYDE